jgi:SPW repeat
MTTERTSDQLPISKHPDIVALRERYERAFETPQAWMSEGLLMMAATYAAISPWVVGFHARSGGLAVSDLIVGLALVTLTLGFAASNVHLHGLTWVAPLMGVWLIITPWVVRGTDRTAGLIISNVIVGACIVLIGAAMTGVSMRGPRH